MAKRLKNVMVFLLLIILSSVALACTPNESNQGKIISLEEAYSNNLLTTSDLQNIAYYIGCTRDTDFDLQPKNPSTLGSETELKIKRLYLKELRNEYPRATTNNISINNYYGTYGDCIAVCITNDLMRCDYFFEEEKDIGGVIFYNYCGAMVSIVLI